MNDHENRAGIEAALAKLLQTAVEIDLREAEAAAAAPTRIVPLAFYGDEPIPTAEQAKVSALVHSPIGAACRQAIKTLGQGLYDLGGHDLMQEVAGRVQDQPRGARTISILDHAWNGVGKGNDRWWS